MVNMFLNMRLILMVFLAALLTACQSDPVVPVVDRAPQATKPSAPKPETNSTQTNSTQAKPVAKEWRPDSYIVKKGDKLYRIGLEFGFDYREIAAANNIPEPYYLKIGQKLDFSSLKTKPATTADANKTPTSSDNPSAENDGVVLTPMQTEPDVIVGKPIINNPANTTNPVNKPIANSPVLTEPKAVREAYSAEAWKRSVAVKPTDVKTADAKPADTKPAEAKPGETVPAAAKPTEVKPADAKPGDDESIAWNMPTQGKISAGFNEATNKGIDIAGNAGQAITAASGGKVIYSGSDLRGYGKLVIIKHNKTYLSVYAHNSKIVVKEGQTVAAGQKIAEMGKTDTSSTKLHFEIRRLGKSVDPAKYLNQN
jgi:lipoprotein NlpD